MKKLFISLLLIMPLGFIGKQLYAQISFQKTYGGSGTERGHSIQRTSDGGYIIAGSTSSFGAGQDDVYLLKIDVNGNALWSKSFGGTGNDRGNSVKQTQNGGFIIAGFTTNFGAGLSDVFLIRTTNIGDTVWTRTYGGTNLDHGNDVQETSDGGFIIIGYTYSFGTGGDTYMIKTNSIGDTLWTKTYGGVGYDVGESIMQTSDGGYIIAGSTTSFGAGFEAASLLRTDSVGNVIWTKTYGGIGNDIAYSVKQTTDGGYIMAGMSNSNGVGLVEAYMIKTDDIGDTLWTRTFGGSNEDKGHSVIQTLDSCYIILGYTYSFGTGGGNDAYMIKTDSAGDTLWTKAYDGGRGESVIQANDGGYVIVGTRNADIHIIKTDSIGNSGCNEYSTNTIVSPSSTTVISVSSTIGSGTIITSPATITNDGLTSDSLLCGTFVTIQQTYLNSKKTLIYPNPFSTYANLEFDNLKNEKHSLIIYNSMGLVVQSLHHISNGKARIERGNLANGLYFFQLRTNGEIIGNGKLIIE